MRTLQEKYNAIQQGKFSKDHFLAEARMQQPQLVTRFNGYNDAVQILKNRGMIVEEVANKAYDFTDRKKFTNNDLANIVADRSRYENTEKEVTAAKDELARRKETLQEVTPAQEKYRAKPTAKPTQFKQDIAAAKKMIDAGKSEKEVVAKYGQAAFNAVNAQNLGEAKLTKKSLTDYRYKPTNEMDKYPYEQILRGLRVELEQLGVQGTPTAEQYAKALAKVSKNLAKDSIFYTNQVAGVNPNVDLHDQMVTATAKNTVDTFNGMKKAALKEGFKKLIKKVLSEDAGRASRGVEYGQPNQEENDFYSDLKNYKDEKQQKPRFTYNDHGDFGDETEFGDEPEEREMFEMYGEDSIDESKVGDLYILAQESEGFEDFVRAVEREYGRAQDTAKDIEELEYIFNSARENGYDDENFSDSMIDGDDLYEVRKAKSLSELLK